jgi:hypothetical protein
MNANVIARKLASLQKRGSVNSVDVANVLQIEPETVSRWNQGKAFPQPEVERALLGLEYVVDQLANLYEPDEVRLWLFAPQKLLNGEIPAGLIRQHRTDEVIQIIRQLLEGVYV